MMTCGKLKLNIVWSWALKCNVVTYATGSHPNAFSLPSCISWGPFYTISFNNKLRVCEILEWHGLPFLCEIHFFELGLMQNPVAMNIIYCKPSRRPYMSFHPFKMPCFWGPQALRIKWSGSVSAFSTNDRFWTATVTGPQSLVQSAQ